MQRNSARIERPLLIVLAVLVIVSGAAAVYYHRKFVEIRENPQRYAASEAAMLVARVKLLIELPDGEEPTVATVTDLEPLRDQPFFARAKVGHKVLIYSIAKKAILFDPVAGRVVETAPLWFGTGAGAGLGE